MTNAFKPNNERKHEPCPFNQLYESKRERARRMALTPGESSDFYLCYLHGFIEPVRKMLKEAVIGNKPTLDELSALQSNGSTALHAATFNGHLDIVKLLLNHGFNRTILNRYGKQAYEEAQTAEMRNLFNRPDSTNRFHELDPSHAMALYIAEDTGGNTARNTTLNYVHLFKTEDEIFEYSLNQETTAFWLKTYDWFTHTFHSWLQDDNFSVNAFDLQNHADFRQFIQNLSDPKKSSLCHKFLQEASRINSIEPLITLYSNEDAGLYGPLNRQLARSSNEAEARPHLSDPFVMEFYLRKNELKQRAFTGTVYCGATLTIADIAIYESALTNHSTAVIALKAFTSTSRDPLVTLDFA